MNWQSVLKAELEEPEVIADVATGDSNFDKCCEEAKDAMRADGMDTIGFTKYEDYGPNGKPIGDYKMISVELDRIHCDWLYEWLDNSSQPLPLLSGKNPERQKQAYARNKPGWDARAKKVNRWFQVWNDCIDDKGGL